MVEATQTVTVATLQQLLLDSNDRTTATMRTDLSGAVNVNVGGTGVRPGTKKRCRLGIECFHLLKGTCLYFHPDHEIAAVEARQKMQNAASAATMKQQYCEVIRDFLWRHDATSRASALLLTFLGVSCPKPDPSLKLRAVLEESAFFEVVQNEHRDLVQHVFLSPMGQQTAQGVRGQDLVADSRNGAQGAGSTTPDDGVGERKELTPTGAAETLSRVRELLLGRGACSRSSALSLRHVAGVVDMREEVLARLLWQFNAQVTVTAGGVWLRDGDGDEDENHNHNPRGSEGLRPSVVAASKSPKGAPLHSPWPPSSANIKADKMAFQTRVMEHLRLVQAYSPDTAVPFTSLGAAVPRAPYLPPLLRCLEELPSVFAVEQLPANPAAKAAWLRQRPTHPLPLPTNPPTPPAPVTASPAREKEKRKSPPKRKPNSQDPPPPAAPDSNSNSNSSNSVNSSSGMTSNPEVDDVDDTSASFVACVLDFLLSRGAVGPSQALPLSVVERECPKPLLLPQASLPAVLRQCPQVLGMRQDMDSEPNTWHVWAMDPSAPKPPQPLPVAKPAVDPKPTPKPTPPRTRPPLSFAPLAPAPSSHPPAPPPLSPILKAYLEQVMEHLVSVCAYSRESAVALKVLGEAVPKPPCLFKIRPVLEDCPLFKLEQDPKHIPVQWIWLSTPASPSTSGPHPRPSLPLPPPPAPKASTSGGASSSSSSSSKPRSSLSKSGGGGGPFSGPGMGPSSLSTNSSSNGYNGPSSSSATADRYAADRYPATGVLSVRDLFHSNPKERAYLAAISRLRSDLEKLKEAGVLHVSLSKTVEADILEFLGDAVLRGALTRKLVDTSGSFFGPAGLHQARMASEQRHTLAKLFDDMDLRSLMIDCPPDLSDEEWKPKGDVVEAILGELDSKLNNASGVPEGHPLRGLCLSVIDKVATAAIDVGQYLKHQNERRRLIAEAKKRAP